MAHKHCSKCGETKPIEDFSIKNKRTGQRNFCCKPCHRKHFGRPHYEANKKKYVAAVNKRKEGLRDKVFNYLSDHPCVDCGESDPVVLDFDHIRGKKIQAVSLMIVNGNSWETIQEEIAKCEVRCANCHRRATAKRGRYHRYMAQKNAGIAQRK